MYRTLLAVSGILASIVSAVPNSSPSCKKFTDSFEDIKNAQSGRAPVSVYNGVTYQGFVAAANSPITNSTGGVVPESGSQDIIAGPSATVLSTGSVSLVAFGNIISSPSRKFDLYSFYFGCGTTTEQPLLGTSQACVISAVGYTVDNQQLPVATFSYAPQSVTAAPMVLATLPSYYKGLKNFTIGVASSASTVLTTIIWVDDVTHCNYS